MSEEYKFGDRAITDARGKITETERKLAAAPAERNSRRWTKYYYRDKLKKANEHLSLLFDLIDQHNRGYKFSKQENQQIDGLAQAVAEDRIIRSLYGDRPACELNLYCIKQNSDRIKKGQSCRFVNGHGEEVIARLTRENAIRREAARRAMLIRKAA